MAPHVRNEHDLARLLYAAAGRGVGPADGAERAVQVVPLERLERRARDALPVEQLPTVWDTRPLSPARLAEAGRGWLRLEVQVVTLSLTWHWWGEGGRANGRGFWAAFSDAGSCLSWAIVCGRLARLKTRSHGHASPWPAWICAAVAPSTRVVLPTYLGPGLGLWVKRYRVGVGGWDTLGIRVGSYHFLRPSASRKKASAWKCQPMPSPVPAVSR